MTVLVLLCYVEIITVHVDTTQRALLGQHCPTVNCSLSLKITPMPGSVWLWGADGALALLQALCHVPQFCYEPTGTLNKSSLWKHDLVQS